MTMTQLYFHQPFLEAEMDYRRERIARGFAARPRRRHRVPARRTLKGLRRRLRPVLVA